MSRGHWATPGMRHKIYLNACPVSREPGRALRKREAAAHLTAKAGAVVPNGGLLRWNLKALFFGFSRVSLTISLNGHVVVWLTRRAGETRLEC